MSSLQEMERLLGINSDSPGANDLFDTTAARLRLKTVKYPSQLLRSCYYETGNHYLDLGTEKCDLMNLSAQLVSDAAKEISPADHHAQLGDSGHPGRYQVLQFELYTC